jgi:hypothetical protein
VDPRNITTARTSDGAPICIARNSLVTHHGARTDDHTAILSVARHVANVKCDGPENVLLQRRGYPSVRL